MTRSFLLLLSALLTLSACTTVNTKEDKADMRVPASTRMEESTKFGCKGVDPRNNKSMELLVQYVGRNADLSAVIRGSFKYDNHPWAYGHCSVYGNGTFWCQNDAGRELFNAEGGRDQRQFIAKISDRPNTGEPYAVLACQDLPR